MSASIHINGTGSSVVDTIFVCRSTGTVRAKWLTHSPEAIAGLVREDAVKLSEGNVRLTKGDIRCITFGHLTRLAVWYLRRGWDRERSTRERLQSVTDWLEKTGGLTAVQEYLADVLEGAPKIQKATACESKQPYGTDDDEIAFPGFDQAPDFIIPSEFNPQVIIEAKITEDDGTARDKVTRIQHLGELSMAGGTPENPKYDVIACIGGRGFGVRREDMKKMLWATRGKVFTLKTLDRLIECTRLREFRTK
ncbi:MAG: hypothetical protein V1736_08925 [Pseudomonadota bacterium]